MGQQSPFFSPGEYMEQHVEHPEHLQREMPLLGEIAAPVFVSAMLIDRLRCEADAVALCWAKRRVKYSLTHAAALMDMPKSHLSQILSGKKYLPNGFRGRFQRLCGNWAIRQWEDMTEGLTTAIETPEQREIRRLKAALAQAQRAA